MTTADPERLWTKVEAGGRIVLPARFRKAAGIKPGDGVQLAWNASDPGALTVLTVDGLTRLLQTMVSEHASEGVSQVDALIAERREEAERERLEEEEWKRARG